MLRNICLSGTLIDEDSRFSLREICELCNVNAEVISEMVEEGLLNPSGAACRNWRFGHIEVRRVQVSIRLRRDLRINTPGAALVLDLLEEVEDLRRQLAAKGA